MTKHLNTTTPWDAAQARGPHLVPGNIHSPLLMDPAHSRASQRDWTLTINNPDAEDERQVDAMLALPTLVYGIVALERGAQGTPHLQGYVYFKSERTMRGMNKLLPRAHLAPRYKASWPEAAAAYCKKPDTPVANIREVGVCPVTQQAKGDPVISRWDLALAAATRGEFEAIPSDIRIRYDVSLDRIWARARPDPPALTRRDFHWWWGPSGTGKSARARLQYPGIYPKSKSKWWCLYKDQPAVLISEWNPGMSAEVCQELKDWCDYEPFIAEVKGGARLIRPRTIIVTSNYSLEACFGHDVEGLLKPMRRRFKGRVRHMTAKFVHPNAESDSEDELEGDPEPIAASAPAQPPIPETDAELAAAFADLLWPPEADDDAGLMEQLGLGATAHVPAAREAQLRPDNVCCDAGEVPRPDSGL